MKASTKKSGFFSLFSWIGSVFSIFFAKFFSSKKQAETDSVVATYQNPASYNETDAIQILDNWLKMASPSEEAEEALRSAFSLIIVDEVGGVDDKLKQIEPKMAEMAELVEQIGQTLSGGEKQKKLEVIMKLRRKWIDQMFQVSIEPNKSNAEVHKGYVAIAALTIIENKWKEMPESDDSSKQSGNRLNVEKSASPKKTVGYFSGQMLWGAYKRFFSKALGKRSENEQENRKTRSFPR